VKLNAVALQIVFCSCAAVLVITGTGFTVTVTFTVDPLHPFAVGVIVYVTVPLLIPSVLLSTSLIVAPLPAAAPLTFALLLIVQLNVVPLTAFGLVIATPAATPLHILLLLADAFGTGFTVTT
jgi:hypothetical protein